MKRATTLLLAGIVHAASPGARGNGNGEPPLPSNRLPEGLDLCESWNAVRATAGWYAYVAGSPLGHTPDWHSTGGLDATPFVSWEVSDLRDWPAGFWGFYPLYTMGWTNYAGARPVNLLRTPMITVSVNAAPDSPAGDPSGGPADLLGGELRFWIAEWNAKTNHAVYSWRRDAFELGTGGWRQSSVTVCPDPGGWEVHAFAGTPHSLAEILAQPQQWGFAIIGATPGSRPSGRIGFDELRVSRRFRTADWDQPDEFAGWFQAGNPPDRELAGGIDGTGFLVSTLSTLDAPTGSKVRYPLWTLGTWPGVRSLHPVNLLGNNDLRLAIHTRPASAASPGLPKPASLGGGVLEFFVGRHVEDQHLTFYRFRRQHFEVGAEGWHTNRVVLSAAATDWEIYACGSHAPIPLAAVLADPQCWGVGLFDCTSAPTGRLGFDRLTLNQQVHTWDREEDRMPWRVGSDPTGKGEIAGWAGSGGVTDSGHLIVPLAELAPWATAAGRVRGLLTVAPDRCWANLHEKRRVRVSLNRTPTPLTVAAGLGGGRLTLFVGRWDGPDSHVFYFLRQGFPAVTSGGWSAVELEFTTDPADWLIVDSRSEPSGNGESPAAGRDRYPLVELLRSPQQWGLAILDAVETPTGWLGIDELELSPPEGSAPRLVPRLAAKWFEFSWRAGVAPAIEVLSSPWPGSGTDWVSRGVWEDDLFGRWQGWRQPPAGPRGGDGEAIWREPVSAEAGFFRLRGPSR